MFSLVILTLVGVTLLGLAMNSAGRRARRVRELEAALERRRGWDRQWNLHRERQDGRGTPAVRRQESGIDDRGDGVGNAARD